MLGGELLNEKIHLIYIASYSFRRSIDSATISKPNTSSHFWISPVSFLAAFVDDFDAAFYFGDLFNSKKIRRF